MADRSIENLSIPENEKSNIERFFRALKKAGQESGYDVETEVVGGTLSKPWPRKDIDVIVKTGKRGEGITELERAKDEFGTLSDLVKMAVKIDIGFKIDEEIEPAMDEEFGSPGILKFNGVIRVKPEKGTLIELIRTKNE